MTEWKFAQKAILVAGAIGIAGAVYAAVKVDRLVRIGAGYKAKTVCSELFVAGRNKAQVLGAEFAGMPATMEQVTVKVDEDAQTVKARGPFGLGGIHAVYRSGFGCTLANAGRVRPLVPVKLADQAGGEWPLARPISGEALDYVDYAAVDFAITQSFEENTTNQRSFLVIVDGKIIDEMYAEGFSETTPFLSWSMAKSVTASLVGAAVLNGYVDIEAPIPVPEWAGDDAKSRITWNDMLRMQSGLSFEENYDDPRSDVNRMLFERPDAGGAASHSNAEYAPGEVWYYSSGTTNLIARTLRQVMKEQGVDFYQFAHDALLDPIGAESVVLEPDASGSFIGSSYVYATARDWARLGQLYLDDGIWDGVRLLPEGWSEYVTSPTTAADRQYGAHFWLNLDGADGRERFIPGLPESAYYMGGHEGQYVVIVPDKKMVMVRTGMTRGRPAMPEVAPLFSDVYGAVGRGPNED
ncbi:serine hydrolase domain-containing protein [Hyphococcus lacteus]|uniref:Serine hydrolase n=1 Tax=Hyphococcus lacteus TaxID=3143536 RepID=A0ABV3Z021_9PROT